MKKVLTIIIGKIIILIGKVIKRGTSIPGDIALRLDKKILKRFTLPKIVIAVTGSSGKGSTSSIIAHIYKELGYKVAHNYKGSNMTAGIITLLLEHCTLTGKIKKDVLIYEVDERFAKFVFNDIRPNYVIITNITRDQPPRQGHVDLVFEEIKKALKPDMHLILNADDPYLSKFVLNDNFEVTYYGINNNKYTYTDTKFTSLNFTHCPICHAKLKYNYYHFETIGDYYCEKKHFKNPKSKYNVTNLNYDKFEMTINNEYKMHIPQNVLFCVYNSLAAFTVVSELGLDKNKVCDIISNIESDKKIYNVYKYDNRLVYVINNKNENATTFNQSLLFVDRYKELKTIVIGWREISRRYNFDDLSWLYDIEFELFKKNNIDKIICVGLHAYDLKNRLKYAGVKEEQVLTFNDLDDATKTIKNETKGNIYAILNFDYVEPFNKLMNEGDK